MKQRALQAVVILAALIAVFGALYLAAGVYDDKAVMIDGRNYNITERSLSLVLMTEDGIGNIARFDRLETLDLIPYKQSARLAVRAEKYMTDEETAAAMAEIDELYADCTDVSDISFLLSSETLPETLRELDLSYCGVSDISALAELTALEKVDISYTNVSDITPLLALPSLTNVTFTGAPVDESAIAAFEEKGYKYQCDDVTAFIDMVKSQQ
ncbi:MAG: leucine-rich repeat domain-containing protein [Oscillospiraceae bacterium]|nr:leucine-rich repeat domain-containing protein [Oscillospiraceae bacterium]